MRPDWLKEGCRVRTAEGHTGTVSSRTIAGLDTGVDEFWIEWDSGEGTCQSVDYWKQTLLPYEPGTKDTNPKDAIGITKSPMSTIPAPFLSALGLAMMEGALKYGRHNYREAGIRYSVYYDAMMRHMLAWWEGEDTDPDSGLPHPIKAAACLAILFDAMVQENGNDDRPPESPAGWMKGMNEVAESLRKRYPDPKDPYTK